MQFNAIKSKVITYMGNRTDMDDVVGDFVNAALRAMENLYDWRHMETKYTGTLSGDNVPVPTRFKNVVYFKVTNSGETHSLIQKAYNAIIEDYPVGSTSPGVPEIFADQRADSKFYLRPYPSDTFSYELLTRNYSADLSADTDTNYITDNAWSALVLGAMLEAADAAYEIDEARIARWQAGYSRHVELLIAAEIQAEVTGGYQRTKSSTFVI